VVVVVVIVVVTWRRRYVSGGGGCGSCGNVAASIHVTDHSRLQGSVARGDVWVGGAGLDMPIWCRLGPIRGILMFNRCGGCRVRGRGAAVLNTVGVGVDGKSMGPHRQWGWGV
jgi:hypothetical protein